MFEMNDRRNQVLDEAAKREILDTLFEQAERVKRATSNAANETSMEAHSLSAAINQQRWWWYPNYKYQTPDWSAWAAHAKRRARFACGIFGVAMLSAIISTGLPDTAGRWMFLGYAVLLAVVASWQLDVSNLELLLIDRARQE